jgi:hypothetical protein
MYAGIGRVGNGDHTLAGGNLMTIHEYGADKGKVIMVISRTERRRQGIHEI